MAHVMGVQKEIPKIELELGSMHLCNSFCSRRLAAPIPRHFSQYACSTWDPICPLYLGYTTFQIKDNTTYLATMSLNEYTKNVKTWLGYAMSN